MDGLPALLQNLPGLGFGFMLVMARVGTTMLTGPGFGETEIPASVRIALAAILSALVYPLLHAPMPPVPRTAPGLLGLVCLEIAVGALIGFLARALTLALSMAGGFISLAVGLSSVLQMDPSIGAQTPALGRLMSLAAVALLFATGLYALPIQAVLRSYDLIPPGGAFDAGGAAQLVTTAVATSFGLALRLAAPFVVMALFWHSAMGLVSRMIPNIQVQVVSAPAQIMSGLVLLASAIFVIFANWSAEMTKAFSALPGF